MKPLRALILEDLEYDALLLVDHLQRSGYQVTSQRVETAEAMSVALASGEWDVILADYRMPRFSAPAALRLLQSSGRDLPFIIVSGTIGEEVAVDSLKAGAHDFMVKGNLARLAPAIERELREVEVRRERSRAEAALRKSEERYRGLLEGVPIGIYRTGPDGTLLDANTRFLEMLGLTNPPAHGAVDVLGAYADPADRERWRATVEAGRGVLGVEFQVRRADGDLIWVRDSGRAVRGAGGEVRYYEGVLEDITGLRAAQEESRRAEARSRALIEYASDIVSILEADGTLRYQSPSVQRILGYASTENLGQSALALVHPEDVGALQAVIARGLADPLFIGLATYRYRHKDKTWRYLESVGRNLLDEPSVRGLVINSRDVTERVLMEQELGRRRRELEALVENAPDAIERFDRQLRFVYANPAVETVRGLPRGGLTGKTHRAVGVPEREAVLWETKLRAVFETGRECTFEFDVSAPPAPVPNEE